MLKITIVKLLIKDFIFGGEGNIINRVGSDISNISNAKSKNTVILDLLAKSILLIKPSSVLCFLTFKARLAFNKLKQAFIKALILHNFDLKCHICIKTDVLDYVISKIFS